MDKLDDMLGEKCKLRNVIDIFKFSFDKCFKNDTEQ